MTAEDLLTRTLSDIAEHTEYPSTPITTVVARSRAIRRDRRRKVAAFAAAAAVAVGGLSAGLALRGGGDDAPPDPAGPFGKIARGAAPRIDYLAGDTFVTTSGKRLTSPKLAEAVAAAAWRDGVLVAGQATSRRPYSEISFVSDSGTTGLGCGAPAFAVPADGGEPVYWLASDCTDPYRGGRFVQGDTSTDTSEGAHFTPVGVVDGGIVAAVSSPRSRLPLRTVVLPPGKARPIPLPLLLPRGATGRGGLVSGLDGPANGSAVVDARTGKVRWTAPASWTLGRFSTSGQYVVGDQEVGRQSVPDVGDVVGIFDAVTGRQILNRELPGLVLDTTPVWEGDDAVLVVAEDHQGHEAIVRITLDGTVTRATDVVPWLPRPAAGRAPTPWFRPAVTP